MYGANILAQCWDEYEKRKLSENSDPTVFLPDHPWELNYLIRKIRLEHAEYTETAAFLSIRNATKTLTAPRKRDDFVNLVMQDLLQRKPCSN